MAVATRLATLCAAPRRRATPAPKPTKRASMPSCRRIIFGASPPPQPQPRGGGEQHGRALSAGGDNNSTGGPSSSSSAQATTNVVATFDAAAPLAEGSLGAFLLAQLGDATRVAAKARRKALRQARDTGSKPPDEAVRLVRLALRRLRNAVRGTGEVFALPGGLRARSLSPAVRALSAPRDAEAEAQTLQLAAKALPGGPRALPRREAKALRAALEALHAQRVGAFEEASHALRSKQLRNALRSLRRPELPPQPRAGAHLAARRGAGELLNAAAQALLSHPAWCIDDLWPPHGSENATALAAAAPWERTLRAEAQTCAVLHDLRKRIRELRYSMERYAPLFDDGHAEGSYQALLGRLAALQAAIGTMRDVEVVLQQQPQLARCGQLAAALRRTHDDAWGAFRSGRAAMLAPRGRDALHSALLPE